jgi:hypothetical protein
MKCLECGRGFTGRGVYCDDHKYLNPTNPSATGAGGAGANPPIVISGGSISIEFDSILFTNIGAGKFTNQQQRIYRVEVTGDGINFSQDTPGGMVTIKIYYANP